MTSSASARLTRLTDVLDRFRFVYFVVIAVTLVTRLTGGSFIAGRDNGADSRVRGPQPYTAVSTQPPGVAKAPAPRGVAPVSPFIGGSMAGEQYPGLPPDPFTPPPPSPPPPPPDDDDGAFGDVFLLAEVPEPGSPSGVAVGPDGTVWVATDNDGPSKVFAFDQEGKLLASHAPAGVEGGITAVARGGNGLLYLASRSPAAVVELDPQAHTSRTYATIPDVVAPCGLPLPTANCDGAPGAAPSPSALAFDAAGNLFVGDAGQGAVWRVPSGGGTPRQWLADSLWTNPIRAAGPSGLAFDAAGNLVVVVRSQLAEDIGVVVLVEVKADGSAGERVELARTEVGASPAGVAVAGSGNLYVTLSGPGRVVLLTPTGLEMGRTPAVAHPVLDTPIGVAFSGTSLVVAAQAPTTPAGGRLHRLPVGEPGIL